MSSNIQRRGSSSSSSSSSGKQRRRSRPRSVGLLTINVAEARRQVCHALQHHRTSAKSSVPSSSSSSSSSSSPSSSSHVIANVTSTQLLQSIPLPEPVWSTTAPSLLPYMSYSELEGAAMEAEGIEFQWGENQASSYTWWFSFLKSLDGNKSTSSIVPQEFKYPLALGNSNWYFGQRPVGNLKVEEADEQIISPDEWLIIPATENHEGEFNHVIP